MLDTALEKTGITADCAERLALEPESFEHAYLYLFSGGTPKWEKFPEVKFNVKVGLGERLNFKVLVIPTITDKQIDFVPNSIKVKMFDH